jgi:predicted nuclease of predicted toxin-antitoxin system
VKLLLDQNLSPGLVGLLRGVFSDVVHVRDVGLQASDDRAVCKYAVEHGLTVVTKDADFNSLALLLGTPPKVIWIQRGNCSTRDVADLLGRNRDSIDAFSHDEDSTVLVLT